MSRVGKDETELVRKVIVVEDDDSLRNLISKKLKRLGYEVLDTSSGNGAIALYQSKEDSLLLLDQNLPDMKGVEVIYELGEKGFDPNFVIMTGQGDERLAVQMMKLGALDYIVKDIDFLDNLDGVLSRTFKGLETAFRLKKAEKDLVASEARHKFLFDNMGQGVLYLDTSGVITYANPAAYKILGYDGVEIVGKNGATNKVDNFYENGDLISITDRPAMITIMSGDRVDDVVIGLKKYSTNEDLWINTTSIPIFSEEGELSEVFVIFEDVTERRNYESELKIAKEKAEESDKLKSVFLANVSHEIRTPLNAILGFVRLLKEEVTTEEKSKYIGIVEKSSNSLLHTINDIIEISRIETGQVDINLSKFDILDTVKLYYELFLPKAESKGLRYTLSLEGLDTSRHIVSDKHKIDGILTNLLSNAFKFTDEGWVELNVKVLGSRLEIRVLDSGLGISKDNIEKIFGYFVQVNSSYRNSVDGSGLGLSIVKAYVDALGGRLSVDSVLGEGSEFVVSIPIK